MAYVVTSQSETGHSGFYQACSCNWQVSTIIKVTSLALGILLLAAGVSCLVAMDRGYFPIIDRLTFDAVITLSFGISIMMVVSIWSIIDCCRRK